MSFGEDVFVAFCAQIIAVYSYGHCSNRALARLASYFWNRVTDHYKVEWKALAASYSCAAGLTGKRKRRGFWHFTITLQHQIQSWDMSIFHEIWGRLRPEERMIWMCPSDAVIQHEIGRIENAINNLVL